MGSDLICISRIQELKRRKRTVREMTVATLLFLAVMLACGMAGYQDLKAKEQLNAIAQTSG